MFSEEPTILFGVLVAACLAALAYALWLLKKRRTLAAQQARIPPPDDTGLIRHRDIPYLTDPGAHPVRHRLDVFAPPGGKRLPVLLFIHGGGWTIGHKASSAFGIYNKTGETFARLGMVVVMANYRLFPAVRHPAPIQDVAAAFAWVRAHAEAYGGDPEQMFLGGHSAGGHLAALLATDPQYLAAHGAGPRDIRGCLIVSGAYHIANFIGPVTDWRPLRYLLSVGPIFGRAAARTAASPLTHVSRGMPPFLMAYADSEWFRLGKQAEAFYAAARAAGASVERVIIENRNHVTIMGRAHDVHDPLIRAAAGFFARLGARISA